MQFVSMRPEAISAVESWMSSNRLRLNADKTQFIWFGKRHQLAKRDLASLALISPSIVDLQQFRAWPGVLLHGQRADDGCSHQATLPFLLLPASKVAGHSALSVERVPACWPLRARSFAIGLTIATASSICGVTAGRLDRLQSILNATVRLVLNIPKFSHISLAIHDELHWLPVQCRSQLVQNLYPRAKQHCRFFATLSTGTLPPCRLRAGFELTGGGGGGLTPYNSPVYSIVTPPPPTPQPFSSCCVADPPSSFFTIRALPPCWVVSIFDLLAETTSCASRCIFWLGPYIASFKQAFPACHSDLRRLTAKDSINKAAKSLNLFDSTTYTSESAN